MNQPITQLPRVKQRINTQRISQAQRGRSLRSRPSANPLTPKPNPNSSLTPKARPKSKINLSQQSVLNSMLESGLNKLGNEAPVTNGPSREVSEVETAQEVPNSNVGDANKRLELLKTELAKQQEESRKKYEETKAKFETEIETLRNQARTIEINQSTVLTALEKKSELQKEFLRKLQEKEAEDESTQQEHMSRFNTQIEETKSLINEKKREIETKKAEIETLKQSLDSETGNKDDKLNIKNLELVNLEQVLTSNESNLVNLEELIKDITENLQKKPHSEMISQAEKDLAETEALIKATEAKFAEPKGPIQEKSSVEDGLDTGEQVKDFKDDESSNEIWEDNKLLEYESNIKSTQLKIEELYKKIEELDQRLKPVNDLATIQSLNQEFSGLKDKLDHLKEQLEREQKLVERLKESDSKMMAEDKQKLEEIAEINKDIAELEKELEELEKPGTSNPLLPKDAQGEPVEPEKPKVAPKIGYEQIKNDFINGLVTFLNPRFREKDEAELKKKILSTPEYGAIVREISNNVSTNLFRRWTPKTEKEVKKVINESIEKYAPKMIWRIQMEDKIIQGIANRVKPDEFPDEKMDALRFKVKKELEKPELRGMVLNAISNTRYDERIKRKNNFKDKSGQLIPEEIEQYIDSQLEPLFVTDIESILKKTPTFKIRIAKEYEESNQRVEQLFDKSELNDLKQMYALFDFKFYERPDDFFRDIQSRVDKLDIADEAGLKTYVSFIACLYIRLTQKVPDVNLNVKLGTVYTEIPENKDPLTVDDAAAFLLEILSRFK
jgi:hypothetical protein